MTEGGRRLDGAVASRRRAGLVSGLRGLARAPATPAPAEAAATAAAATAAAATTSAPAEAGPATPPDERCDLCGTSIGASHRHLLGLADRRILCACEACWAMRSGEGDYRPTGNRTLWLGGVDLPDDLWATFQIPIGLAFFMESTVTGCVVAMYPSPAGATESELHFDSWARMRALNPQVDLEADIEGLIVNRLSAPAQYVIAPIDRCYELTGTIKAHWEGISGGPAVKPAVDAFFARLRAGAVAA